MVGWCFYFSIPLGAVPAASFAADYITVSTGGGGPTRTVSIIGIIAFVAALNAFGVRLSGPVQLALSGVLAALLVVAAVAAAPHAHLHNATPFAPHGWTAIGPAAAVLVWGFVGWEAVTSLTAEYRRPRHDLPRATALAVVVVAVLYLAVAAMTVFVLGPAAGASKAPLADLLVAGFGAPARGVTTAIAVLLTVGTINAYFGGAAKLGAALGRDGSLPVWFARGSNSGEVPRRSLAVLVVLCTVSVTLSVVFDIRAKATILLITGSFTLVYVLATAAAIKLLPPHGWGRIAAAISLVCSAALLLLTGVHIVWGICLAAAALGYEYWRERTRPA